MSEDKSFVGLDVGAGHTRLVALDLAESGLRWLEAPGASMDLFGADGTAAMLAPLIRRLASRGESEVVAAVAGADSAAEQASLAQALSRHLEGRPVRVVNDAEAALVAEVPSGPALVVVAGSGANAMARGRDGQVAGLRAKGYLQGNDGGGLDLTRRALHAAFRAEEGSSEPTALVEEVLAVSGKASYDELSEALSRDRLTLWFLIERVPPLVTRLAELGDEVSRRLLAEMGQALAGSARAAAIKADLAGVAELPVVLAGGLFRACSSYLEQPFREALASHLERPAVRRLSRDPACGALLLAVGGRPELAGVVLAAPGQARDEEAIG